MNESLFHSKLFLKSNKISLQSLKDNNCINLFVQIDHSLFYQA